MVYSLVVSTVDVCLQLYGFLLPILTLLSFSLELLDDEYNNDADGRKKKEGHSTTFNKHFH